MHRSRTNNTSITLQRVLCVRGSNCSARQREYMRASTQPMRTWLLARFSRGSYIPSGGRLNTKMVHIWLLYRSPLVATQHPCSLVVLVTLEQQNAAQPTETRTIISGHSTRCKMYRRRQPSIVLACPTGRRFVRKAARQVASFTAAATRMVVTKAYVFW